MVSTGAGLLWPAQGTRRVATMGSGGAAPGRLWAGVRQAPGWGVAYATAVLPAQPFSAGGRITCRMFSPMAISSPK